MKRFIPILACLVSSVFAVPGAAENYDDVLGASLLTGWRQADGSHMAAVKLQMAPGWKTYWRAPGDAGIPPLFDTRGSGNLRSSTVIWPRPVVFHQNDYRSIGYKESVVLPLRIVPTNKGRDITFKARIDIGVCKDICIPQTLNVSATLPASAPASRDGRIAAALADRPYSGKEVGASKVTCTIAPSTDGITLSAAFSMPSIGRNEALVIETANPLLWVAEPDMSRSGQRITASTTIQHVEGRPFALNRKGIRITILGENRAVELQGCSGG